MKKILHFLRTLTLIAVLPLVLSCNGYAAQPETTANFTAQQIQQIQQITREYLLKNPQILMEMAQKLQQQATVKEQARLKTLAAKYHQQIFNALAPGRISLGNPNGKIILAEFLSYECPHCKTMSKFVDNLIKSNPDLQVIYIYWPFQGNEAIYAAKTVLAATELKQFTKLHHALMEYPDYLSKANINKVIAKTPINAAELQKIIAKQAGAVDRSLKENFKLATQMNLLGTPTIFIANRAMTKFSAIAGEATEADLQQAIKEVR